MSRAYAHRKDRWLTRAVEWVLFALAWSFRMVTWPVPTRHLTGFMAPLGGVLAVLIPGARARADANLAHVWPDLDTGERRRIIRDIGCHFMRLMIEYARLDKVAREVKLTVHGGAHLEAAKASGKGAVIVSAHYGNWEGVRFAAKQLGCDSGIIYRAFNNRYLDRFTLNLITCAGEPVLQKSRRGMRRLVTHVARGGVAMILVDQRNSGAPFIPFLGQPAETVTVAADLALRTGTALIPAYARRNVRDGCFDVVFEEPVTGDDAHAMMAEVNRRIGAWIEAAPEQWFWFHQRWKSTARRRRDPEATEEAA